MKLGITALSLAALFVFSAHASTPMKLYPTFAPENNLYIGVNDQTRGGIDESTFNSLVDRLERIYKPIFKNKGGNLSIVSNWQDGTVNAYTMRQNNSWQVHLFGGLARIAEMTKEGYAMVICHEFGHQIGGLPKKTSWWGIASWAAAEGQSDYFAAAKCMKMLLKEEDNGGAIAGLEIPAIAQEKCEEVYGVSNDRDICIRTALGAEVLGGVLNTISGSTTPMPRLDTPSTQVVQKTNVAGYPSSQCRTDTYFQGALCDIPGDVDTSETDIHQGYCARENGYEVGTRPLCWFSPTDTYESSNNTWEY